MKQCLIKSQTLVVVTASFLFGSWFAFWHSKMNKWVPVGYQDEGGFHYGALK